MLSELRISHFSVFTAMRTGPFKQFLGQAVSGFKCNVLHDSSSNVVKVFDGADSYALDRMAVPAHRKLREAAGCEWPGTGP